MIIPAPMMNGNPVMFSSNPIRIMAIRSQLHKQGYQELRPNRTFRTEGDF